MKKKLGATMVAVAAAGTMFAAPVGAANLSVYNHTSTWEMGLEDLTNESWTCEKTEVDGWLKEVDTDAAFVVVKGGNVMPAHGFDVTMAPINPNTEKPYGISWYMECNPDDGYEDPDPES